MKTKLITKWNFSSDWCPSCVFLCFDASINWYLKNDRSQLSIDWNWDCAKDCLLRLLIDFFFLLLRKRKCNQINIFSDNSPVDLRFGSRNNLDLSSCRSIYLSFQTGHSIRRTDGKRAINTFIKLTENKCADRFSRTTLPHRFFSISRRTHVN